MPIQSTIGPQQGSQLTIGPKSLQKSPQRERFMILGAPTDGKTTCALTSSAKFDPKARGDGVVIDDICVITADAAALNYARALGYEFSYWLDLSEHLSKPLPEFNKITAMMLELANKYVLEGKTHTTIFDNISTVDGFWRGELAKHYEGWPLQDKMDLEHKRLLLEKIMPVAGNMILLAHTKTVGKMDDDKRESLGIDAGTKLVMDISSWNAPKMYRAQTSQRVPIKKIPGKTIQLDQYNLYPRGVDGIEYGGRYPQISACDKVPADMKVLMQLIRETARAA